MKIESKFKIATVFVFLVMLLIATVPYSTNRSIHSIMSDFRSSLEQQSKFDQLLDVIRDAETAQRGFVITGKEVFLQPYYQAISQMPSLRQDLTDASGTSEAQQKATAEMFRIADLKLAELAETIAMRRAKGFAEVEPIVSSERGKKYMDTLRELIGRQESDATNRRNALRAELERKSEQAFYVDIYATLANLILLAVLMTIMFRVLKQRQKTATLLHNTAGELSRNIAESELRNEQMKISAEMLQALGAIASLEKTSNIIAIYCGKLLPEVSGKLYLYRNSRDLLEGQASWGPITSSADQMEPGDCWALQRGGAHYTSDANDLCCKHYIHEAHLPTVRLCIPLVTQGEVIGLIYFSGLSADDAVCKSQQRLIDRVAEQIALALSNVKLRETLRRQSITDPLTGLYNRRYMDETLKRELYRAERKTVPLAVIVLDLDHFKRINDTFGHEAGDMVLKSVAQQIRENIRESDLACRFGGEELVLILPECDLQIALARANKIQIAINTLNMHYGGRTLGTVTGSFGVAAFPEHGRDPITLMQAADHAMYQAKQAGRNCIVAAVVT
ncbi:MAG TPA: diguanylate cyclase [Herminiimonas sp.]|nr:diguanylate cyclase [Herminiimonas sp.]